MARMRFPISEAESVELIRQSGPGGFFVTMGWGDGCLHLDFDIPNDRTVGEALLAIRQGHQDDKDRVGDPRG